MCTLLLRRTVVTVSILVGLEAIGLTHTSIAQVPNLDQWTIHDEDRAQPMMVDPGPVHEPLPPPSDALVLFDGSTLSHWEKVGGGAPGWKVENGFMQVMKGTGAIQTKEGFGDVQLHVEWASSNSGEGQNSGNSGIFLMGLYEVQVLNSNGNKTYPDGQASAVYGQYPPLVNASRPAGQWQTYDIIFHRPRFDGSGKVTHPARVTVLHNGVLVQDNVALTGPTGHHVRPPYEVHADKLPLQLQDHNEPVRYRNIWARPLPQGP
jgi:hypothetical protein